MKKKTSVFLKVGRRFWIFSNKRIISFVGNIEISKNMSIRINEQPVECYSINMTRFPCSESRKKLFLELLPVVLREDVKFAGKLISDISFELDGFNVFTTDSGVYGVLAGDNSKGFFVQTEGKNPEIIYEMLSEAMNYGRSCYYSTYDINMMG